MGPFRSIAMPDRRHHPDRTTRLAAFTLIELVLVIATIAVLSAIAVPRYADALARYRTDLAAKRVAADLLLARANARTTGTVQVVNFAADGYTLTGMPAPDGGAGDYAVRLSDEPYGATLGTVAFGDPPATSVTFDRYGTPNASGGVVVKAGRHQKTVSVDVVSGKAVIN